MKIIFVDVNKSVTDALSAAFKGVLNVQIVNDDIRRVDGDALVSPANSYGWMNGGIDAVYLNIFGYQLQVRVQLAIAEKFDGFLPVGRALSVHTMGFGPQFPKYLIAAPTMQVPGLVGDTQNAFMAFSAALEEASRIGVSTLICPGMCSLTGGMIPAEMARQMRAAFDGARD